MASSTDILDNEITRQLKSGDRLANISKEQFLDYIDLVVGELKNTLEFFNGLKPAVAEKLKTHLNMNRRNTTESIRIYNHIFAQLQGAAKKACEDRFGGGFQDTIIAEIMQCKEVAQSIDTLFANKSITIFNSKLSHVAVYGMIYSATIVGRFTRIWCDAYMSDMIPDLAKLAPYQIKFLESNVNEVAATMNLTLNTSKSKAFVKTLLNYRNSGSDILLVNGTDNASNAKFAKTSNAITDNDITTGSHGIGIFFHILNFFNDWRDASMRKLKQQREQIQSRVVLLELALDGADPNSAEYQKQIKIIENYNAILQKLDRQLDAYYGNSK